MRTSMASSQWAKAVCQQILCPNRTGLKVATDQAIAACGGDAQQAVKALPVATEFLESQIAELQAAVSNGYARGKFESVQRDRKDWYD
jgi:hypothetical protein